MSEMQVVDFDADIGAQKAKLDRAVVAISQGEFEKSRRLLMELREQRALGYWPAFYLGRLDIEDVAYERAQSLFEEVVNEEPKFFWGIFEYLRTLLAMNAEAKLIVGVAAKISDCDHVKLEQPHVLTLEKCAHLLWDAGHKAEAVVLLERCSPSADLNVLGFVRLLEGSQKPDVRAAAAERLRNRLGLDSTAWRILKNYYREIGDADNELTALRQEAQAEPKGFDAWLELLRALDKAGASERVAELQMNAERFSPVQLNFAAMNLALDRGHRDQALVAFITHARLYRSIPLGFGVRLTHAFMQGADPIHRDVACGLLQAYHPSNVQVQLLALHCALQDHQFEKADAIFEQHFAHRKDNNLNIRIARLDILAYTGRLQETVELLLKERQDGIFPQALAQPALRLFGEASLWREAFEAALPWLEESKSFEHFFSPLVRAARKVHREAELLEHLLKLPRPLNPAQLQAQEALVEDLVVAGDGDVLAKIPEGEMSAARLHRIAIKNWRKGARPKAARGRCIYYCVDENYLEPALVSLTGLAMSNISLARRLVFFIIADTDILDRAKAACKKLGYSLGLSLTVVDASKIVSDANSLRSSYGIFTGGQELSLAAYYRIFFAHHLAVGGEFDSALYIDADTIVRAGIEEIYDINHAHPLMARFDSDRPEVRHAIAVNQLKGGYFNSGVMKFDLRHELVVPALERSISVATNPEVTLIFQDQCALNIGFDQNVAELPPRFNYFFPPSEADNLPSGAEAVILHYLDRPKPWDSLYTSNAREWLEWYDLVMSVLEAPA
jgi:lipopolysaccharide biosynthesis glycosyltransferase